MGSATAITVTHIERAVAIAGGNPEAVRGDVRLPADPKFSDRISLAALIGCWERAIETTGQRALPRIAAAYREPDERSLVLFVIANQRTLGAGIDRFARYGPLISDGYQWRIVDHAETVHMVASPPGPIERLGWQCHLEFEVLDAIHIVHRLAGAVGRPRALRFLHPPPTDDVIASYAELTAVAPRFGEPTCEAVFSRAIRDVELPTARPALAAVVEAELEAALEAEQRNVSLVQRARAAIATLLALERALDVDRLARALAMSRRSLERALEREGTSAAAVIEDERRIRALAWLPTISVEEVAARLGYSDARSFARAFKRWTGVPPSKAAVTTR